VVQSGHVSNVNAVAVTRDGKLLASGGNDKSIRLWDTATGTMLRMLTGHLSDVQSLAFSPDGDKLLSGSFDGTVKLWEVATGKNLYTLRSHTGPGFSDSFDSVAYSGDGQVIVGAGRNDYIMLWDAATGKELRTLEGHEGSINSIALSADGKTLVSASFDKTVKVWDMSSGTERLSLAGHKDGANIVAISRDGKRIATGGGGYDGTVKLWDATSGKELYSFSQKAVFATKISALAFSADGHTLAGANDGEKAIRLWEVETGKSLAALELDYSSVRALAFVDDKRTLASVNSGNIIRLWETSDWKERRVFDLKANNVEAVAASPDHKWLASATNGKLILWEASAGRDLRLLFDRENEGVFSVVFSPDSKQLASGTGNGEIVINDVASGKPLRTFKAHDEPTATLAYSPDGKLLASGSGDKQIKLWEAATGKALRTLSGHDGTIASVAFSPDGKTLASGGWDNTVRLWDVSSGRELHTIHAAFNVATSVAFSPDGKTLASGDYNQNVRLWDVGTGNLQREWLAHEVSVEDVAFSPDGKIIASAGGDNEIKLWDAASGKELRKLLGHSSYLTSVSFSTDGKTLVSASYDGTIKLWETASGLEIATLLNTGAKDWLVVTPDGLFDGSPGAWNQILWRFAGNTFDVAPVELFFNEFYYPDLLAEIFAGKRPRATQDIAQRDRRQPQLKLDLSEGQTLNAGPINQRTVNVKISIDRAPAGAQDVRLFRNGALVRAWRGDVLKGPGAATLDAKVTLVAGDNRLTAYAFNKDNVKSADASLTLKGAESLRRKGIAYIIATGVDEYTNPDFKLKFAVADAQDFGDEMLRQQTNLNRYESVKLVQLFDAAATKANIIGALDKLSAQVQPEDAVVVFFAGHGVAYDDRFYLVPHDMGYEGPRREITPEGLETLLAHGINDRELEGAFEKIDGGQLSLVIDACNSGQALEASEKRRGPMNSRGLAQLAYEKGLFILTAAQSYQFANEEPRLGHGYLTYALIEQGLKGAAADQGPADGQITIREWFDYATRRVPEIYLEQLKLKTEEELALLLLQKERGFGLEGVDDVQRPRAFYRRDLESEPLIVARTASTQPRK
jgi:WD40 repeat protein